MSANLFRSWIKNLGAKLLGYGSRRSRRLRSGRANRYSETTMRPQLEMLEDRVVPAYLTPSQVNSAYGVNTLHSEGDTGTGQTIAIIDPGDDANIASDLAVFDSAMGLPAPPSFQVVGETGGAPPTYVGISTITESGSTVTVTTTAPHGLVTGDPITIADASVSAYDGSYSPITVVNSTQFTFTDSETGLANSTGGTTNPVDSGETSLDVEWAHALAPGANIVLIELANGLTGNDIATALTTGVPAVGASVVSMSFSGGEYSNETSSDSTYSQSIQSSGGATESGDTVTITTDFSLYVSPGNAVIVSGVGVAGYDGTFQVTSVNGNSFTYTDSVTGLASSGGGNAATPQEDDGLFTQAGVTYVASTGDDGAPAGYPATSPDVLAAGATNLYVNGDGSYNNETGWSNYYSSVISSATESNNTVTITTNKSLDFLADNVGTQVDFVNVFGVSNSGYDGTYSIQVLSSTSFTYYDSNSGLSASSGGEANNENQGGSGGGPSSNELQPIYQSQVPTSLSSPDGTAMRTTPDVSIVGGSLTPVSVYDSLNGGWGGYYGTSLSAPCLAGLVAISDQIRAAAGESPLGGGTQTLPILYSLYDNPTTYAQDFHDITSGNNGYSAGTGYDLETGIGSPVAVNMVPALADVNQLVYAAATGTTNTFVLQETGGNLILLDNGTQVASNPLDLTTSLLIEGSGTVAPVVTPDTMIIPSNTTSLTISGFAFDSNSLNDSVTLSSGVTGTVTAATSTSLIITVSGLSTLATGTALTAIVTVDGISSVSAAQVATVAAVPAATASTTSVADNSPTITINGTGFFPTAAGDSVVFNLGVTGTVTSATATQLIVTITTPPTSLGSLTAVVTSDTIASGAPVQVATEVSADWIVTNPSGGSGGSLTSVTLPYAAAHALNGDQITFASSLSGDTIFLSSVLSVSHDVTITGLGAANLAIGGNHVVEVFDIGSAATVSIANLTIENGQATQGGGLTNAGTLTLSNVSITGNTASGYGGAVYNSGTMTLSNVTISGNTANTYGGGIDNFLGTMTLSTSTISGNTCGNTGGGIYNYNGTLTLSNDTITSNSADYGGGIITGSGTLTLSNDTISGNSADTAAGGIYIGGGSVTLLNTIVDGNTALAAGADILAYAYYVANNDLLGSIDGSVDGGITGTGNQIGVAAGLASSLANNGGPTLTLALQPGSAALGTGGALTSIATGQPVGMTDTTIYVTNADAIAVTQGSYYILIDQEEMLVTNVNLTTNTLTVQRGVDGTTANLHNVGASVYLATDQRGIIRPTPPDIGAFQLQSVTPSTAPLFTAATSFVINGSGFDTTAANDQVTFNNGVNGTVISATSTSLTVNLTGLNGLTAGTALDASVTIDGVSSGSPVQVATIDTPTIITTSTLPNWTVDQPYSQTISVTGGINPFAFAVFGTFGVLGSGSLPTGLTLNTSTGTITGTPTTTTGSPFNFTISVTDSAGYIDTKGYTIVINPQPTITTTLPNGTFNQPYSQTITVSGGTNPDTFAVTSGSLPTGFGLNSNTGAITGTPSTIIGSPFSFTITATDVAGATASMSYSVAINPPLTITTTTLPTWTADYPYSQTIAVVGGTNPDTFAVTGGSLPTGLGLNASTGAITGTPSSTNGSPISFTITVTDAAGATASQSYTLLINAALVITSSLPNWTVDEPYSQIIDVSGGTDSHTFALTTGSLPTGLSLNNNTGAITGTPSTASGSPFSFTITVTDAVGATASQIYDVTINPQPTLEPTTFPIAPINLDYYQPFPVLGGTAPFTFSLLAGSLPAGLNLNNSVGAITGAATTNAGNPYTFTIEATDVAGATTTQVYSLTVQGYPNYTVTNTSGDVAVTGSLPWAVNQANLNPGLSYITFDIPGSGTQVITLTSSLWINSQTVIDGTTQPGYDGTPLISVQGTAAVPGLFIFSADPTMGTTSSGSTLQGLDLYSYTINAVTILPVSQGNYIQNNYIGFYQDSSGAVHLNDTLFSPAAGYETNGIALMSSYDTIRWNTISGDYIGLNIGENPGATWSGTAYYSSGVLDNNIGTDPTGTTSAGYGNLANAIFLGSGAQGNFLGPYNVLSGNGTNAVEFEAPSVTLNVLFSNLIGTDISGMNSIPNGAALAAQGGGAGVVIANGAYGNCVGGPFGGNFISGNGAAGVVLENSVDNFVQDNIIGLNSNQTAVVGSQAVGVSLSDVASGNVVTYNVIAGTTNNGVSLTAALGNNISNNWLGENTIGVFFADAGFGIAFDAGTFYSYVTHNYVGSTLMGVYYVSPQAGGNYII